MPWNECKPMDERLRFKARLLEGEKMAPVCREFGISRKTGYKLYQGQSLNKTFAVEGGFFSLGTVKDATGSARTRRTVSNTPGM